MGIAHETKTNEDRMATESSIQMQAEKIYRSKLRYFQRPMMSNHPYQYELVKISNPGDFVVQIKDYTWEDFKGRHTKYLDAYQCYLQSQGKFDTISRDQLYEGMPVLLKFLNEKTATTPNPTWFLQRGEVTSWGNDGVEVYLVDRGGFQKTEYENLLPVTIDLVRIPKLGFPCRLAQVIPEDRCAWSKSVDYEKDFTGKRVDSQFITFMDYYPDAKLYDVVVEVDEVNIALKYFHAGISLPVALSTLSNKVGDIETFPKMDYSGWIGLKVAVFGLKVFSDEQDDGRIKCILQLQPEMVNQIQDFIAAYVENPENKKLEFEKKPGSPCLARFGPTEYFRAVILKKLLVEGEEKFLIHYVDYEEKGLVPVSDMMKLPSDLPFYPEGATVCQITDFINEGCKDMDKLKEMVENQDLYAVVDAADIETYGPEILVSLYKPEENENNEFTGAGKSFSELFAITNRPCMVLEILQCMEPASETLESTFLQPRVPDKTICKPDAKLTISAVNDDDVGTVWVKFFREDEASLIPRMVAELLCFYMNNGCEEDCLEKFRKHKEVGMLVAAQNREEKDGFLYRAKILQIDGEKVLLHYIDYGEKKWLPVIDGIIYPLHAYFTKDPVMAVEMKFV